MNEAFWFCLFLYIGLLAWEDYKSGHVSLPLLVAGSLVGLGFQLFYTWQGNSLAAVLQARGLALVWGGLLLLSAKLSREAIGTGDALCFLSFAFWLDMGQVFILLLLSLLLSACAGIFLMGLHKKGRKDSLPLLPFVWISLCLYLLIMLLEPASP